jgi:diguanylate cyclase (GGDEF)-like protein
MPLHRSFPATLVRSGARLVVALLPLAAVAAIRAFPELQGEPLPWVGTAIASAAAVVAGLALFVAVAAVLEDGRIRDLADLAALGMLGTAFTVLALNTGGTLSLGIGVTAAAAAFLGGSLARQLALDGRRARVGAIVVAVVLVEATLAGILLTAGWSVEEQMASFPLAGGALLLALAALAGLDSPNRATALGIFASAAVALAIGGAWGSEGLVGASAMAVAAAVLGWRFAADRRERTRVVEPAPSTEFLLEAQPQSPANGRRSAAEAEFDELSRITRELRATLDDLVAARHLIELQRIEIDRVSTIDPLTGLTGRWPTLDRLRTEAAEARRYAHPLAAVLFDIDGFANLNHDHGLQVGDAILREVALRLRVRMREADLVGRIGADAFLAILPHSDELGAATFARAVLDRLVDKRIVTDRGEIAISLSVGIALMRPGTTLSGDELLAAAEEALASAKAAGGNRIAFDGLHETARIDDQEANAGAAGGEMVEGGA